MCSAVTKSVEQFNQGAYEFYINQYILPGDLFSRYLTPSHYLIKDSLYQSLNHYLGSV